ncbi:MAG TPA: YraN family protein [Actinomycetota bacterium]
MRSRDRVWHEGERAAWGWYWERGYRLVARNWRSRVGELDLVVERGGTLVFCEVKARASALAGPFDAVTPAKQRKVRAVAEAFLLATGTGPQACRFDVASVVLGRRGARVHVFEDAF